MENYSAALKAGLKYQRQCISRGDDPGLKVLDQIIPPEKSETGTDIGLVDIPLEYIIGTKTAGRSGSFAGNFMPIAKDNSEFAAKWVRLCKSQMEEGIREPVQLIEYMNRFYAVEGNKRISVLKFVEAISITAQVKRILPDRNGDPEVEKYYAFLAFSKKTGINFLEMSDVKSYDLLLARLDKPLDAKWDEDEIKRFRSRYYLFRKNYLKCGGDALKMTIGDALLAYINIYSFDDLANKSEAQIRNSIYKIWEELALQQEEEKLLVKMDPDPETTQPLTGVINRLFPKKIKAAFLYLTSPTVSYWIMQHEIGRLEAEKRLAGKVETITYECETDEEIEKALHLCMEAKVDVIFATATEMVGSCLKVAVENPGVQIMVCALNKPHRYIRSYFPRVYEAKFIAGAIAGAMSGSDRIGYICKYPVYGSIAEINAFARGAQLTNPNAEVHLEWAADCSHDEAARKLVKKGIDMISVSDHMKESKSDHALLGLEIVDEDATDAAAQTVAEKVVAENQKAGWGVQELREQISDDYKRAGNRRYAPMVLPVTNWGEYYEKILLSIINGSFRTESDKTSKSLSYYWGMSAGVVKMVYSSRLPKGIRYMAELLYKSICSGQGHPFYKPEEDEDGNLIWDSEIPSINIEDIIRMETLESNVIGELPTYEELEPKVQKLVDVIGIDASRRRASL